MKIKNYIIIKTNYEANVKDCFTSEAVEQKMKISANFLEDKRYIDIDFSIKATIEEELSLFELEVIYRVELEEEVKEYTKENVRGIIQAFYPTFKKYAENFYKKEAGLEGLKIPKF